MARIAILFFFWQGLIGIVQIPLQQLQLIRVFIGLRERANSCLNEALMFRHHWMQVRYLFEAIP